MSKSGCDFHLCFLDRKCMLAFIEIGIVVFYRLNCFCLLSRVELGLECRSWSTTVS